MDSRKKLQADIIANLAKTSDVSLSDFRHNLNHHLNVVEWILELQPKAADDLFVAALLHDCDRFYEKKCKREKDYNSYEEYKDAHAKNCARIAVNILQKIGFPKSKLSSVEKLIIDHEVGQTSRGRILMTADSLSYFEHNIFDYYIAKGLQRTKFKINFMGSRLPMKKRKLITSKRFAFLAIPALHKHWQFLQKKMPRD